MIPLYNKEPHIARTLESVLSQTFRDFEVIVVNDGSTDNGADIVQRFGDHRVRLIQQENRGVSSARNLGIEVAEAPFIAFLDADDEWAPDHLETLERLFKKHPDAGAYGTAYMIEYPESKRRYAKYFGIPEHPWEGILPSYFKTAALGEPPITASTVGIPKKILVAMGGFCEDAWYGEDTDLWGKIALKYPIAFSWVGSGIYHGEAINRACLRIEAIEENIFVSTARKAIETREVSAEIEEDLLEYVDLKLIQSAARNLQAGRPDLAQRNIKSCYTNSFKKEKYWVMFWAFMPNIIFIKCKKIKRIIMSNLSS